MKTLITTVAAVLFLSSTAFAADNDDDRKTWARWQEIGAMTNCAGDSIDTAVICGGTTGARVEGYSAYVLEIFYDYAAGTGIEFYPESCYEGQSATDCTDATDWHRIPVQTITATGVALSVGPVSFLSGADAHFSYTFTGLFKRIRLNGMVATGSPSGDEVTVNLRALYVPSF